MFDAAYAERPIMPRKTAGDDDSLLDAYIAQARKGRGLAERQAKEARVTRWHCSKQLTNGKAIKDASRDDGRLLVEHMKGLELKSATIQKRMGWLVAATKFAIDEGKLKKFNLLAVLRRKATTANGACH